MILKMTNANPRNLWFLMSRGASAGRTDRQVVFDDDFDGCFLYEFLDDPNPYESFVIPQPCAGAHARTVRAHRLVVALAQLYNERFGDAPRGGVVAAADQAASSG